MAPEWLVLKLGGTSVSRKAYWRNATARIREALAEGQRVLVVHSALAGVTNRLEALIEAGCEERPRILKDITARHRALADELAPVDTKSLDTCLRALGSMVADTPSPSAMSPSHRACVLAQGEYLMSSLALPVLQSQRLPVRAVDARELLTVCERTGAHPARHYLLAACDDAPDEELARRLRRLPPVVLTQGFIARDAAGDTVLLGRGGSDMSAAYLAAKLSSAKLEIWTDVPGLFTADPRELAGARLLREVDYDEALEIAATGAKVLHPRCIRPLDRARIPLVIRYTPAPTVPSTRIGATTRDPHDRLKAVCLRRGITVVTLETPDMWQQPGFLADVFACFKRHDVSVDMVATAETCITVTLDPSANPMAEERIDALCEELSALGEVSLLTGCAISLVGRRIRANLHRIAPLLEVFRERQVHLVSQSSNDLNVTFVVDESEASRLVAELHALLIGDVDGDEIFGPAWETLCAPRSGRNEGPPWWQIRRDRLLVLSRGNSPRYVYDAETVRARAERLLRLVAVDRLFYAVKANWHADVLRVLYDCGLGFECVSGGELKHLLRLFPDISRQRLLFTPNFVSRSEYAPAFERGAWVTLDNLCPLRAWPELFAGRDVLLRVDIGHGRGHHRHVRTAGAYSKFGIPVGDLEEARQLAKANGTRIVGLHAHAGSGIMDTTHWRETGLQLAEIAVGFPGLRILNLGGGLGVPERPGDAPLNLEELGEHLAAVREACAGRELWLEPGRFLVAEAGVLLTRVTQLKSKGETRYLGVDAGMNSLLRPALYGAYHPIVNLSRHDEPPTARYTVVGPICETGDVLGVERRLPESREGDVLLIANAGAYGHVMSSTYNLRQPADEVMLEHCSLGALS